MGMHLRVLNESYPKNTQFLNGFQKSWRLCALDEKKAFALKEFKKRGGETSLNINQTNIHLRFNKSVWYSTRNGR